MSTRRQRRSPKWLKRQRQKRQRQRAAHKVFIEADYGHAVSHFVATQWVWFEGRCFAFDADHPEEFERAIAETGLATAEVTRDSIIFTAVEPSAVTVDVGWPSLTLDPTSVEITRVEEAVTRLVSKPEPYLNRAQRRARGR